MEKEYRDVLIFNMVNTIKSYDDTKDFYELCNNTIKDYNKIVQGGVNYDNNRNINF